MTAQKQTHEDASEAIRRRLMSLEHTRFEANRDARRVFQQALRGVMSRYLPYIPDQGSLVPLDVAAVLGSDHLCFFVHRIVERLDLRLYMEAYGLEGGLLYHPSLMLKVWLYAYALGVTSSRRLERRIREDLAFRYRAGGAKPDYWALNAFRKRHTRARNDSFTQVLELARQTGLRQMGTVAIDNASLEPMVELIEATCGQSPGAVVPDSGYYSNINVERMEQRGIDAYVPDSNLARELNLGQHADDLRSTDPHHIRMRAKMRTERGTSLYRRPKALAEPVFGVLKQQRQINRFRMRTLDKVAIEFTLAALAYNITRLHRTP